MTTKPKIRVGLVVPHIFIHRDILPGVIFSPGKLALDLAEKLGDYDIDVTLLTPGPTDTNVTNITADLSYFEQELTGRGDSYIDLLKKHPFTFISLARQVQSEIIARSYDMANNNKLDIIHVYTNEEDIALPFAKLCNKPVVFTHHDPFNFLVKYKNVFPKYKNLSWISLSLSQRKGMPSDTNWVGNIYHGLDRVALKSVVTPANDYVAYLGRIIEPKGVHIAIQAIKTYNKTSSTPIKLKIAGKHYSGNTKDTYWQTYIEPELGVEIEYVGHIKSDAGKREFLGNAKALLVPSTFDEPFGMVTIESLACGTPVIGLDRGATPEIISHGTNGFIVPYSSDTQAASDIATTLRSINTIDRSVCRDSFEARFTSEHMASEHAALYRRLTTK